MCAYVYVARCLCSYCESVISNMLSPKAKHPRRGHVLRGVLGHCRARQDIFAPSTRKCYAKASPYVSCPSYSTGRHRYSKKRAWSAVSRATAALCVRVCVCVCGRVSLRRGPRTSSAVMKDPFVGNGNVLRPYPRRKKCRAHGLRPTRTSCTAVTSTANWYPLQPVM